MTPLLLAATEATQPTVSEYGVTLLALAFITRWLWDYNRAKREEAAQHEPKSNPPLHQQYTTRAEHAELKTKVEKLDDEVREGFTSLDKKRSVSIAGLHTKLDTVQASMRAEIKADLGGVHDRINDVLAAVSEIKGARK